MNDETYGRDCFQTTELLFVQTAERAATQTLVQGMERGDLRTNIKRATKNAVKAVHGVFETISDGRLLDEEIKH